MTDNEKTPQKKQPDEPSPTEPAKPDADAVPVTAPASEPDSDTDDSLDFGGLPARNLKKNLGCGG